MTLDKPDRARQVEKSFSKTHVNLSACTPGRTRFHGWQFRWGGQEAQGSESEEEHDLQVLNRCFTVLASDNTSRLASPCRGDFSSPSQTIKFKQNSGVTTERREELLQRPLSSRPQGPCRASALTLCPLFSAFPQGTVDRYFSPLLSASWPIEYAHGLWSKSGIPPKLVKLSLS